MWVYIKSEPGLWTVGHYDPAGKWIAESDHHNENVAAARVHWLNGGKPSEPRRNYGASSDSDYDAE